MTFDQARAFVVEGKREDWHVEKCLQLNGPSYRDRLTSGSTSQDGPAVVCADSHDAVAVYATSTSCRFEAAPTSSRS